MSHPHTPAAAAHSQVACRTVLVLALLAGPLAAARAGALSASSDGPAGASGLPGFGAKSDEGIPLGSWTDGRCGGCHVSDPLFSHPLGVQPSMAVPPDLPLVDGRIACITCHDDRHATRHEEARQAHTPLLRGEARGDGFCTRCHKQNGDGRADMHARMLGRAHLKWPGETDNVDSTASRGSSRPFDAASEECLSCHDGSVAADIGHDVSLGRFATTGGLADQWASHPIGVEYRGGGVRDSAPLRPRMMLDDRIRLFDNRVGCGSCHSPYSGYENLLVMSNLRSRLCLNCHDY